MKAHEYTPVDRVRFDEMLRDARRAERHEHLKTYVTCWIFAPEYARADVNAVLDIVEREKGWREHGA